MSDLTFLYLSRGMKDKRVKWKVNSLLRLNSPEYSCEEEVFNELYCLLKEKEGKVFSESIEDHSSYFYVSLFNLLNDLLKRTSRELAALVPLDTIAEGRSVLTVNPLGEISLRDKLDYLLTEGLSGWSREIFSEAIHIFTSGFSSDVSPLRESFHRSPIRAICADRGISPSSATRLINELKVQLGIRETHHA